MINKLFLDLNNFKPNLGSVERGDNIELNIKLLDSEDYSRSKFRVLGTKADGKYVEQIEGINLEEKDLKVILEDQFVNCEGIVKLELNVVSGETEITTKEFYFFVSNTMNASIIDSVDSLPTLEKVSKYVDDAVNNLDALKEASVDIALINSEFKENEIKRKANEMLREKNEKARLQSEDIRITGEEERETNELERIQAENDRKVSESNRKLSENKRKTNERAREEAELSRQSTFEENEEIRNENENLRIASEKERIKFNSEAKTDELNRKESEKNRVLAEEERKSSEEARVSAEAIRQNTYTDFNDSEVERKNNEIKRQEAETLRVEAETRRDNLFAEKEEERNTSFIESEKVRNAAFNKAQDSRNTVFEESETIREEAFKISEKARNDAEELRVTAESERSKAEKLRVDSEKARVLAEEERNTTFTQKEEERNNTFTQNETNRNETFEVAEEARTVAETSRIESESSRVEAEKLRVAAEDERVEAENLRVAAEDERVAAETKREEGFNKFEGKINSNTEELKNARSATTGEEFNSLDERIDCEVDRLNKKIEVSMLQQEDKESHVVENTIEGMTANMIVKGRTLINIHPKSIYRFNAPSSEENKYTQDKSENSVIANISEELTSWSYVECGVINRDMFKPNTKYTIIGEFNGIESVSLMDGTAQYSMTNQVAFNNNRAVVQIKSDEEINRIPNDIRIIIYCYNKKTIGTVSAKNVMILEGDWTNKTTPQYFEGIKSFGQQEDKISSLSHGKNFFSEYDTAIFVPKGEYVVSSSVTEGAKRLRIKCEKDDLSNFGGMYYDASGNYQTHQDSTQINNITFTVTRDCYLTFKYLDGLEKPYNNIQLEKGSVSTKYEPYRYSRKDILLQDLDFDEGLRGLGDAQDEIDSIKDRVIKKIEKYTFIGNENIVVHNMRDNTIPFTLYFNSSFLRGKNNNVNFLCSSIITTSLCYSKDVEGAFGTSDGIYGAISKTKLESNDSEGVIKYLRDVLKECYYELAEPVETPLNESIALKVYNEKTYVNFENSIKGTSSFKAPVNTVAIIARLNRENRALEEENLKLKENMIETSKSLIEVDTNIIATNWEIDFRVCEIEWTLEDMGVESPVNLKIKKGVGNMALSRYEQAKIMILGGVYEKETLTRQLDAYLKRKYVSQEEYDELIALMEARDMVTNQ